MVLGDGNEASVLEPRNGKLTTAPFVNHLQSSGLHFRLQIPLKNSSNVQCRSSCLNLLLFDCCRYCDCCQYLYFYFYYHYYSSSSSYSYSSMILFMWSCGALKQASTATVTSSAAGRTAPRSRAGQRPRRRREKATDVLGMSLQGSRASSTWTQCGCHGT